MQARPAAPVGSTPPDPLHPSRPRARSRAGASARHGSRVGGTPCRRRRAGCRRSVAVSSARILSAARDSLRALSVPGVAHRRLESPEGQRQGVNRRLHDALVDLGSPEGLADDFLGRGQVHLDEDGRHREDIADIVEAVSDIVGRELIGRAQVQADQVADRVVVFGAVEAADSEPAGPWLSGPRTASSQA